MIVTLIIGVYNVPAVITFGGLLCSVLACVLSFNHQFELAFLCFIFAGLCDLFDGFIARRFQLTKKEKEFGLYIDTVVDIISFGFVPVILLLHSGFNRIIDYALYGFFCSCAAMRLAIFTQLRQSNEIDKKTFIGFPVTYSALVFSSIFILGTFLDPVIYIALARSALFILGLLYIIKIKIPKPRGVFYIVFPSIAIGYMFFWILKFTQ